MNQRGSALLAALWLLTVLAAIGHWGFRGLEDDVRAAMNRISLSKAAWAREACLEIAKDDFSRLLTSARRTTESLRPIPFHLLRQLGRDSIALGEGVWCSMAFSDVDAKLDLNSIDSATARCLVEQDDHVVRWMRDRPYPTVAALARSLVLDSAAMSRFDRTLSTYSTGSLNVNSTSAEALACAAGISVAAAQAVIRTRDQQGGFVSVDEMMRAIPIVDRPRSDAFRVPLSTSMIRFALVAMGAAGQPTLRAMATAQAVISGDQILVFQTESE